MLLEKPFQYIAADNWYVQETVTVANENTQEESFVLKWVLLQDRQKKRGKINKDQKNKT